MADPLAVLRTAKAALEDGLISDSDYKKVRDSFVAAQQIRSGLDHGIFKPEEIDHVKERFFQLLQMHSSESHLNHPPAREPTHAAPPARTQSINAAGAAPSSAGQAAPPPPPPPPPMMVRNGNSSAAAPAARSGGAPPPPPPPMMMAMARPAHGSDASLASGTSTAGSSRAPSITANADARGVTPPPSGTAISVKNLAGVQLDSAIADEYMRMRTRRAYRWLMFRIEAGVIILDRTGGSESSHDDFASALPTAEPRYSIYDHHFMSTDGLMFNKLVFVFWCPEDSPVRLRMTYAAAKDAIKQTLDGISADVQASCDDEISLESIDAAVKARIMQG